MDRILIKGGLLHTMQDEGEPVFTGDILVESGKIVEVAASIEDPDAKIINASGLHVLPGLIDAHSHIGLFDFNHDKSVDDANEMTDPVSAAMDARYGMNPKARELKVAYEHGITSMLFTPGSGDVFCGQPFVAKTYGDNIFDMTVKAPAAVKIALGGNPKNTFGDLKRLPMTRMGVAHVLWDTFRRAKKYLDN
ncbi:MAG: amidohydrolase, partial [Negativibacillus sp.]